MYKTASRSGCTQARLCSLQLDATYSPVVIDDGICAAHAAAKTKPTPELLVEGVRIRRGPHRTRVAAAA